MIPGPGLPGTEEWTWVICCWGEQVNYWVTPFLEYCSENTAMDFPLVFLGEVPAEGVGCSVLASRPRRVRSRDQNLRPGPAAGSDPSDREEPTPARRPQQRLSPSVAEPMGPGAGSPESEEPLRRVSRVGGNGAPEPGGEPEPPRNFRKCDEYKKRTVVLTVALTAAVILGLLIAVTVLAGAGSSAEHGASDLELDGRDSLGHHLLVTDVSASGRSWHLSVHQLIGAPLLAPCARTAGSGIKGNATTSRRRMGTGPTARATAQHSAPPWLGSTVSRKWCSCCAIRTPMTTGSASRGSGVSPGNGPMAPNSTTRFGSEEEVTARI